MTARRSIDDVVVYWLALSSSAPGWIVSRSDQQVFESTDEALALKHARAPCLEIRVRCFVSDENGLRQFECADDCC